jgi:hypothetical protein
VVPERMLFKRGYTVGIKLLAIEGTTFVSDSFSLTVKKIEYDKLQAHVSTKDIEGTIKEFNMHWEALNSFIYSVRRQHPKYKWKEIPPESQIEWE